MIKKNVFMVMPFGNKDAQEIYEHCTRKICEKFKLEIRRADELFTTNVILEDILEEIENASVIIVDISGKNPNVFYELGMAHILKRKQTIIITKEPHHKAPFDVQHFRIIHYDNTVEGGKLFEEKLTKTLENLLLDYSLIYKDEFKFIVTVAGWVPLSWIICLPKIKKPPQVDDELDISIAIKNEMFAGTGGTVGSELKGFINLDYVKVETGLVVLTEKGKAFVSFLENRGFICDYVRGSKGEDLYGWKEHIKKINSRDDKDS